VKQMLEQIKQIAKEAGDAILTIYESDDFNIEHKADDSPLTRADSASHQIIAERLAALYPDIPQISEEAAMLPFTQRSQWSECFVIDPLDGTKEFIARNGEFTVNIALINQGRPILGVIYVPVQQTFYFAAEGVGAFKQVAGEAAKAISVRRVPENNGQRHFTVVASRRHGFEKVEALCQKLQSYELTSRGSSLKMCLVAEGEADFYPRLAPTSEWDTAAAQAIVEQAGGQMVNTEFQTLTYNQRESILNPHFYVLGDPEIDWKLLLNGPS